MTIKFKKLYKQTSTGDTQVWWMEREGNKHRTCSGKLNGKIVTSGWTVCTAKNVGKANEVDPYDQAIAEIEAKYKKKLEGRYHEDIREIEDRRFFEPMLAKSYDKKRVKKFPIWLQPKLDGARCIAKRDENGDIRLYSRNGKEFVNCPHIVAALEPLFRKDRSLILDGELYNHDYKHDFNSIISAIRKQNPNPESLERAKRVVQYHVYDIPSVPDIYAQRAVEYQKLIKELDHPSIVAVQSHICYGDKQIQGLHNMIFEQGYEGSIIRLNEKYENKRSFSLMKLKDFITEEFEILDIESGLGNWAGYAKIATLKHTNGNIFSAGIAGDMPYCKKLLEEKKDAIGKPGTVVYQKLSPDGVPIFGVLHSVRDYE